MWISRNIIVPLFLTMVAMLLVSGCTHVISKQMLNEVDRNATFAQVVKNPDAYKGKTVLFGGAIIETKNLPERTIIAVLQRPLSRRGEPAGVDVSEGRFIIQTQGFLDPAIYSPGRQVTVAGKVLGKEVYPMGEIQYAYPLIEKRELFLWPVPSPYSAEPRWHFGFGFGTGGVGVGVGTTL